MGVLAVVAAVVAGDGRRPPASEITAAAVGPAELDAAFAVV